VQEFRCTLRDEAAAFPEEVTMYVREHEIPQADVYVADVIGLWSGAIVLRTRVYLAIMDVRGHQKGDSRRDTGMVTLSAAAEVDASFVRDNKQITCNVDGQTMIVTQGISTMGATSRTRILGAPAGSPRRSSQSDGPGES
jgi:hypothetical protein